MPSCNAGRTGRATRNGGRRRRSGARSGCWLSGLEPDTRTLLAHAAVFRDSFGFDEIEALTQLDEARLLDALDEALATELLRSVGGDRYGFSQPLVRHVLYDRLAPSRRARVHRRLAELLEPSGDAAEIARQYHASAALPGADKGVPFALAAAQRADPAGAVELLTLALDLGVEDRLRTQVVSELALAYATSGRPTDAVLTLTGAVEEMERLGAPGGEIATVVYRVLSLVLDGLGSPVSLEPLLARALAALGRERGLGWARLKLLERPVETVPAGPIRVTRFAGLDPDAVRMARGEGGEADEAMAVDEWVQWPLERLQGYGGASGRGATPTRGCARSSRSPWRSRSAGGRAPRRRRSRCATRSKGWRSRPGRRGRS